MAVTNIQRMCHNCYGYFNQDTMVDNHMYCTQECANQDAERLAEGNAIVKAADLIIPEGQDKPLGKPIDIKHISEVSAIHTTQATQDSAEDRDLTPEEAQEQTINALNRLLKLGKDKN